MAFTKWHLILSLYTAFGILSHASASSVCGDGSMNGCVESQFQCRGACFREEDCCSSGSQCCDGIGCPPGVESDLDRGRCLQPSTVPEPTSTTNPDTYPTSFDEVETVHKRQRAETPADDLEILTDVSAEPSIVTTSSECLIASQPPQATAAGLPIIFFTYQEDKFDDIPVNVCLGIRHKLGFSSNSIVLTYAEDGCSEKRGRDSGCPGYCKNVVKPPGTSNAGQETQCDEFPFKSTAEGGGDAWKRCVVDWQNSLQGHLLRTFYNSLEPGDRFVVMVSGLDCATVTSDQLPMGSEGDDGLVDPPQEHRGQDEILLSSGSEIEVRGPRRGLEEYLVVPLGDLDRGNYEATAWMTAGRLIDGWLIDSDGDFVDDLSRNQRDLYVEAGMKMRWVVDEYLGGVALIGRIDAESSSLNLTWEFVELSDTTSTSPSGTSSTASSTSLLTTELTTYSSPFPTETEPDSDSMSATLRAPLLFIVPVGVLFLFLSF